MTNMRTYEEEIKDFNWAISEKELGYKPGDVINIGEYCSDRICRQGKGDKLALIWEGHAGEVKQYTFNDMRLLTNTIAQYLKNLGLQARRARLPVHGQGARALLRLPGHPEDGRHRPAALFGLRRRIAAHPPGRRRHRRHHHPEKARGQGARPAQRHARPAPHHHRRRRRHQAPARKGDRPGHGEGAAGSRPSPVFPTKAETPSVLHYTSGTTGKPKGAQHVHYSLISQYITAKYVLDLKEDDIYWCTADPGWVTGTSYGIIGAWANGVTQCVLDAGFKAESWYRFIEKYRVTVWYSAPTAIRSLMKEGDEIVKKFDLSCLRHLCSVGEPLNAEAVLWSQEGLRPDVPRHLLADRDRQHDDHQLPDHEDQARLHGQALPGHHRHRGRPEDPRADHQGRASSA